jgi:hypothetical protein
MQAVQLRRIFKGSSKERKTETLEFIDIIDKGRIYKQYHHDFTDLTRSVLRLVKRTTKSKIWLTSILCAGTMLM